MATVTVDVSQTLEFSQDYAGYEFGTLISQLELQQEVGVNVELHIDVANAVQLNQKTSLPNVVDIVDTLVFSDNLEGDAEDVSQSWNLTDSALVEKVTNANNNVKFTDLVTFTSVRHYSFSQALTVTQSTVGFIDLDC